LEEKLLGDEPPDQFLRLACQVKIESPGDLVVSVSSRRIGGGSVRSAGTDVRKRFGELTLEQKIATLLQLEAITMSEALDAAMQKPLTLGTRALEAITRRTRTAHSDESQKKQAGDEKANDKSDRDS
jgi:hypothetical protein